VEKVRKLKGTYNFIPKLIYRQELEKGREYKKKLFFPKEEKWKGCPEAGIPFLSCQGALRE